MCDWRRGGAPTHASVPICAGAPSPRTTCPCRTAVGSCGARAPKPSSRVQPPGTAGAPRPRATRRAGRARTTRSIARPAGRRDRASAAQRDRPDRARVDAPARSHRPAVNVYFHTFGCKANQYDTERVRAAFDAGGAVAVDDPALADLAVINSCTVTHESEVKLKRLVRQVARKGAAQTIVMGCAAALDDGTIAALPSVRAVVASADPVHVLAAAGVDVRHAAGPRPGTARSRGLLKIQDGCDEHCTFCATTLARGAKGAV